MTLSVGSYSFSFWPFSQLSPSRKREKRKIVGKKKRSTRGLRLRFIASFKSFFCWEGGTFCILLSGGFYLKQNATCSRVFFLSSMSYPHKRQSPYVALSAYLKCEVFLRKKSMNPKRPLTMMNLFCCSR